MKLIANKKIAHALSLGIVLDGWTNCKRNRIVNVLVTTPQPVYLKSIDTGSEIHSGEYMAKIIASVFDEYGPEKFVSVCTDNASNMKLAWNLIEQKYAHVVCIGCIAHGLNLLCKDFAKVDSIEKTLKSSHRIIRGILKSNRCYAMFNEVQNELIQNKTKQYTLKLSVETRWGSYVTSLRSMLQNKRVLKTLYIKENIDSVLKSSLKRKILDESMWDNIDFVYKLLKPIARYITFVESDNCDISSVCSIFFKISSHINLHYYQTTV